MKLREQMKNMDYDKTDFLLYNLNSGNRETIKKYLEAIDYDQPTNEITVQCLPVCVAHVLRRILPTADQSHFFAGNTDKIEKALEIFDSRHMCIRLDILFDMVLPVLQVHLPNIDAEAELTLMFTTDYLFQILKELDSIEHIKGLMFPFTGGMLYEPQSNLMKYIASVDPASDTPDVRISKVYVGNPPYTEGHQSTNKGQSALEWLGGCNNTVMGLEAGLYFTNESNKVIIGDYIRNMDKSQPNTLFIGDNVAIGKTLFGKSINLFDVITEYYNDRRNQEGI